MLSRPSPDPSKAYPDPIHFQIDLIIQIQPRPKPLLSRPEQILSRLDQNPNRSCPDLIQFQADPIQTLSRPRQILSRPYPVPTRPPPDPPRPKPLLSRPEQILSRPYQNLKNLIQTLTNLVVIVGRAWGWKKFFKGSGWPAPPLSIFFFGLFFCLVEIDRFRTHFPRVCLASVKARAMQHQQKNRWTYAFASLTMIFFFQGWSQNTKPPKIQIARGHKPLENFFWFFFSFVFLLKWRVASNVSLQTASFAKHWHRIWIIWISLGPKRGECVHGATCSNLAWISSHLSQFVDVIDLIDLWSICMGFTLF